MSPKNKVPKPLADRAEPSKAEAIATAETAARDGAAEATTMELPTPRVAGDNTVPPLGREETPKGVVQESRLIKM
jgi:hypothetical protein